jgi:hypothetical protein
MHGHDHPQKATHIDPVGLGSFGTAIDFKAGRVDDIWLDLLSTQAPSEPESVVTRLETAMN